MKTVKHGTLHQLGTGGCWMARRRTFQKSEIHEAMPEPEQYSVRCKLEGRADPSAGAQVTRTRTWT